MDRFLQRLSQGIEETVREADRFIKSRTPVHEGTTVRNYIWTTGTPFGGLYNAIDTGPTGSTNRMTLGSEPRRKANEAAAEESLSALDFTDPFQTFILSNNAPQVAGLELGLLPGPPMVSRSPQGMFGITHEYIMAKVRAQGIAK